MISKMICFVLVAVFIAQATALDITTISALCVTNQSFNVQANLMIGENVSRIDLETKAAIIITQLVQYVHANEEKNDTNPDKLKGPYAKIATVLGKCAIDKTKLAKDLKALSSDLTKIITAATNKVTIGTNCTITRRNVAALWFEHIVALPGTIVTTAWRVAAYLASTAKQVLAGAAATTKGWLESAYDTFKGWFGFSTVVTPIQQNITNLTYALGTVVNTTATFIANNIDDAHAIIEDVFFSSVVCALGSDASKDALTRSICTSMANVTIYVDMAINDAYKAYITCLTNKSQAIMAAKNLKDIITEVNKL